MRSVSDDPTTSWDSRPLGGCLTLLRNGLSKPQNRERQGLPVTRIETIASGKINPLRVGFIDGLTESDRIKYRLQLGDILFSHINSEPQIGRTALYEGTPSVLIHGMNLLLLRPSDCIDSRFLHFALSYLREIGATLALAGRAVGQSSVNQGRLRTLEIPFPPLPEQRQIAEVLGLVQRAMEQQEQLLALSAELRKALLHQLFTHGLRHEPDMAVPDALAKFKIARTSQLPSAQIKETGKWPVIDQGQSFVSGYTDDESKVVRDGLPLVIFGDHTRCVKYVDFPFVLGADGTKVLKADEEKFRPKFLYYALSALDIPSRGYNRHFTLLREKRIKHPDFPVQDDAIERFTALDQKLSLHRRKHAALTALFRTLLHELMTARIRVHDW